MALLLPCRRSWLAVNRTVPAKVKGQRLKLESVGVGRKIWALGTEGKWQGWRLGSHVSRARNTRMSWWRGRDAPRRHLEVSWGRREDHGAAERMRVVGLQLIDELVMRLPHRS